MYQRSNLYNDNYYLYKDNYYYAMAEIYYMVNISRVVHE